MPCCCCAAVVVVCGGSCGEAGGATSSALLGAGEGVGDVEGEGEGEGVVAAADSEDDGVGGDICGVAREDGRLDAGGAVFADDVDEDEDVDVVATVGGRATVVKFTDVALLDIEDTPVPALAEGLTTVCMVLMPKSGPSWNAGGAGGAAMGNVPAGHAHAQWHPPLLAAEALPTIPAGMPPPGLAMGVAPVALDVVLVLFEAEGYVKPDPIGLLERAVSALATMVMAVVWVVVEYIVVCIVLLTGAADDAFVPATAAVSLMLVEDKSSEKLNLRPDPASSGTAAATVLLGEVAIAAFETLDDESVEILVFMGLEVQFVAPELPASIMTAAPTAVVVVAARPSAVRVAELIDVAFAEEVIVVDFAVAGGPFLADTVTAAAEVLFFAVGNS